MPARSRALVLCVAALCLTLIARTACAQTPPAVIGPLVRIVQIPIQLDFLNPGARSLGIGSSFTAVADDATAAMTNPAGLSLLTRPEVSGELRYRTVKSAYATGGRFTGTQTGTGTDTTRYPLYGLLQESAGRPSFLSFVYPRGRWSIAGYRHEVVRQHQAIAAGAVYYRNIDGCLVNCEQVLPAAQLTRDLQVDAYGAAISFRVWSRLALGAGLSIFRTSLQSRTLSDSGSSFCTPLPAGASTGPLCNLAMQSATGTNVGLNAGILVMLGRKWRVGVAGRQGASVQVTQSVFQVTSTAPNPPPAVTETGLLRLPWFVSAGFRVQVSNTVEFAGDLSHTSYTQLASFNKLLGVVRTAEERERFGVIKGNNNAVHFGVEYLLARVPGTPTIRAGVWTGSHGNLGAPGSAGGSTVEQIYYLLTAREKEVLWHYCFGFGLPLSPAYEFNFGADLTGTNNGQSDNGALFNPTLATTKLDRRYISASFVARFGH